jgi:hypothetical protein
LPVAEIADAGIPLPFQEVSTVNGSASIEVAAKGCLASPPGEAIVLSITTHMNHANLVIFLCLDFPKNMFNTIGLGYGRMDDVVIRVQQVEIQIRKLVFNGVGEKVVAEAVGVVGTVSSTTRSHASVIAIHPETGVSNV